MFTKKRKDYRTFIFITVVITLCLLIIAIAWPTDPEIKQNDDPGTKANSEQLSENQNANSAKDNDEKDYGDDDDDDDDWEEEDNFPPGEKTNISDEGESYYLVKKAGDAVKVFFVDHSGNEIELEDTNIIYDMLSYDDQALFDQGYKVKSQEELAVLLQDFES